MMIETSDYDAWLIQLQSGGYRLTAPMRAIIEILCQSERILGPVELFDIGRKAYPKMGLVTVYRTLELLVSLDLVVETHLEGVACYYEVSPEPTHHHFVCTACGSVGHFGDELLTPVHDELTTRSFEVSQIQVTAFGLCQDCRTAAAQVSANAD